ncbi:putative 1-phosphatidylinositol-4,5-bisphosphate phosphodiesterase 1 [Glarea lozoyensis 74030]|uniref:Phosphoinositide phospholipase C n=1 Tax=Glarea lozoyensis (strain ATCC 74030 / MF5533) TaxID=1104152 RepID=H0EQC7_GLAL7|nr:putative 1-phosphatidylinositol-4,5-bisphosphate phosphodiesterase 1 [Glarea lozoyensis 74030]
MASLTSRLSDFNPFSSKSKIREDDDDKGEQVTNATVAGGGHSARETGITKNQLRVSHALKSFLVEQKVLSAEEVGLDGLLSLDETTEALRAFLDKPHIDVPSYLTDRSHPLPEYFISSSHNTYLVAHQLFGDSSAEAYSIALHAGSRCVEIDAWDNDEDADEPKVTHGYTLVSHISFRSVCETIRDVYDKEAAESKPEQGYRAAPIMLSLENHCGAKGQLRLVQIMKEVWGDRLLSKSVREEGHQEQEGGQHVTLAELGSKIVVIVEHHIPGEITESDSDSSSDSEDEEQKEARKTYKDKEKAAPATVIIPELADLGVYAQSVKPSDNSWYDQPALTNGPHHHLINVSESGLSSHMPAASAKIGAHNAHHLMRVFPKGTRISSKNLNPVPFWGVGAQICALNWQTFGAGMQMNEALFSGTDGYVLKPPALRAGGSGSESWPFEKKLRLHIAGATDVPIPKDGDADAIKPYVTCSLVHPDDLEKNPPKRKTAPYKQHKLSFLHKGENPASTDPVWDEVLEWTYEENELVFLRMLLKSDDSFASNPVLAVAAVRVVCAAEGWRFVRLLDLKGEETRCSLLVKFEVGDA